MAKNKKSLQFGSIISGVGLGILLGIWMELIYSFNNSAFIYIVSGIIIFGGIGIAKQRSAEVMAYAVIIFVILQMSWDYSVGDRGDIRMSLLYGAVSLLIINIFTGHYHVIKPWNIFKKALGLK